MVEDKKEALKKFIRDYLVAIATSAALVILLAALVLARHLALSSVSDVSKINPLITSEQNELVALQGTSEVIKIPKDDEIPSDVSNTGVKKTQSPNPSPSNVVSETTNSEPSGSGTGNSAGNGNSGSNPPVVTQPFATSIGQMSYTSSSTFVGILSGCKVTYNFQAVIQGHNAPGTVTYRWLRSSGSPGQQQQVSFAQGDTSKTVTYTWSITGYSGNYSVTLEILTPKSQQKTLTFKQTCSL